MAVKTSSRRAAHMRFFATRLVRQKRVSKNLVRLTFQDPTLSELYHAGTDQRIKIIIPQENSSLPYLPSDAEWYDHWLQLDPSSRPYMRTYTIADYCKDACELDVDFVDHRNLDGSFAGPGTALVSPACIGREVGIISAISGHPREIGVEFTSEIAQIERHIIVGDLTALPAVKNILKTMPASAHGIVCLLATEEDWQPLQKPAEVKVVWCQNLEKVKSTLAKAKSIIHHATHKSSELAPTLVFSDGTDAPFWEETDFSSAEPLNKVTAKEIDVSAWVAGKSDDVKILRKFLINEIKIPKQAIMFMGYWK